MLGPAEILARSPLFSSLPELHRAQIAPHLAGAQYAAGAEIVRQGDAADALYLLASGSAGV